MSWNEPNNDQPPKGSAPKDPIKDPWRQQNKPTPPDLDDLLRQFFEKIHRLFGGKDIGKKTPSTPSKPTSEFSLLVVAIVLSSVVWFASGIYSVQQAEQVVVLRFGKFYGLVGPGLQWRPRFIDNIQKINTERVRTFSHKATILTHDKNMVDIQVEVQYRVSNPRNFVLKIQDPINVLAQVTESALRQAVGNANMDDVITEGRHVIAQEVLKKIQSYLDSYATGLTITKINIEDAHPPNDVKAAFDDVIKAKEDEERLKNEAQAYANGVIPEARGHAMRQRQEAEAYRQEIISHAQGEAERFSRLLAEYKRAPDVTRHRLYLETMESVLAKTSKIVVSTKGNNMLYLPLDKLNKVDNPTNQPTTTDKPATAAPTQSLAPTAPANPSGREGR